MSLPELYRSLVLEHNRQPQHCHPLPDATHQAEGVNAMCGDELTFYVSLHGDTVLEASFTGQACAIVTACASMLTEYARGRNVAQLHEAYQCFRQLLADQHAAPVEALGEFNALLEVRKFPGRTRCATLPWATLEAALAGEPLASTERSTAKQQRSTGNE